MKRIILNKHVKLALTFSILVSFIIILFGGFATQQQDSSNSPIFWSANRLVNGIGVLCLIIGWGFWEYYSEAKTRVIWTGITSIVLVVVATIMINGIIGLIGGCLVLALISSIFILSLVEIQMKEKV